MKLQSLYLDSFGHFRKQGIDLPEASTVVFLGPNEAGKSTLLAFIRGILFGFPAQYSAQHYPSLNRGEGGRVAVVDQSGICYTVERRAGPSGGPWVTSRPMAPWRQMAQSTLTRLTGGTSPEAFRNIYAFTLDELQSVAQLKDHDIYGAAQGAVNLASVQNTFRDRSGAIFLTGGSKQHVPQPYRQLQSVSQQLQEIQNNARLYGDLTSRQSEVELELKEVDLVLEGLRSRRSEIDRLLSGWDGWVEYSDCHRQLQEAPIYVDFPENPIIRIEGLESQIREAQDERQEAVERLKAVEDLANAVVPDEDLLYDRALIESVFRGRDRYDSAVKDLPDRRADVSARESELKGLLGDLGTNWDEQRLQEFTTTIEFRQEVEQSKGELDERREAVTRAENRLEQDARLLEERHLKLAESRELVPQAEPSLDANGIRQQRNALLTARSRLGEYERARQNYENIQFQADSSNVGPARSTTPSATPVLVASLIALCGVLLVVFGALLGGTGAAMGVIAVGVVLLAAAALIIIRGNRAPSTTVNPLTARAAEAGDHAEAARRLLQEAASSLSLQGVPTSEALDLVDGQLVDAQARLATWKDSTERVETAERDLRSQQERVESTATGLQAARESYADSVQEWRAWLNRREIPPNFTPDTVIEFLGKVETARVKLDQVNGERRRADAVQRIIDGFFLQIAPLAERHGLTLDPDDSQQLAAVADQLVQRMQVAQDAYSDREKARSQMETLGQELQGWDRRLGQAEGELTALLAAGGTDDSEEFRRRARQNEERQELVRQLNALRRNLETLSGPGEKFETFRGQLAEADPNALRGEASTLEQRQAEVESGRNVLNQELGEIRGELARLTSEEESSGLRIRRNSLLEQLQGHAREWAKLTIAEELLNRTRRRFEQERQPKVIQHAQQFFSAVTGERYRHLYAPLGEQTITVVDADGSTKTPTQLSRGTREQLYLALRFGLIRGADESGERLPVVVDEALVNFDLERARLAAAAFGHLSETNQVLVFTCHPATAEMFEEAAGAQVVDISGVAS